MSKQDKQLREMSKKVAKIEQLLLTLLESQKDKHKKYLDVKEAANYLNYAESTVYTKVNKKELPFRKQGRKLYFLKEELDKYIEEGLQKTNKTTKDEIEFEIEDYFSSL